MTATEENILVVPRRVFDEIGAFDGLCFDIARYMPALLDPNNNLFLPRAAAENDPSYKQLIPYLIIRHGNRVLRYTRGKSGGEARLHAKISIGIGGHINEGDTHAQHFDTAAYERAVERELHEELTISGTYRQHVAALLNDDETPVGRVHLGIVHVIDMDSSDIKSHEDAISDMAFVTATELESQRDHLENWSRLCLDALPLLLQEN